MEFTEEPRGFPSEDNRFAFRRVEAKASGPAKAKVHQVLVHPLLPQVEGELRGSDIARLLDDLGKRQLVVSVGVPQRLPVVYPAALLAILDRIQVGDPAVKYAGETDCLHDGARVVGLMHDMVLAIVRIFHRLTVVRIELGILRQPHDCASRGIHHDRVCPGGAVGLPKHPELLLEDPLDGLLDGQVHVRSVGCLLEDLGVVVDGAPVAVKGIGDLSDDGAQELVHKLFHA